MPDRFLIVEDDPLVAMMLEGYLESLGKQTVGCAEDVAGALAHIASLKFDAVILDLHLASGETSEPVADALTAADIPFILATGSGASSDTVFADAPYLAKPFSLAALEAAIDQLS